MKTLYSLISIFSMTLMASNSYSQCVTTSVSCQPGTDFPDATDYDEGVYGLTLDGNTINSLDAWADGGYHSNDACSPLLITGSTTVSISVETGPLYPEDVVVFIDYNNNGQFDLLTEKVFESNNVTGTHTGSIDIPYTASTSYVWLRVKAEDAIGVFNQDPCVNSQYSQIEDFPIQINPSAVFPPVAAFSASSTVGCLNDVINFTDESTNTPTSWDWTITHVGSGTPYNYTDQNPSHQFTLSGTYHVSLTATNADGNNTLTKNNYITINDCPTGPIVGGKICGNTFSSMTQRIQAATIDGATQYEWEFTSQTTTNSYYATKSGIYLRPYQVDGIEYGDTYDVRVRANVGGSWTDWGPICQISTPTQNAISLASSYCGNTYGLSQQVQTNENVVLASDYWWQFTPQGGGGTIDFYKGTGSNTMRLYQASLVAGETYSVRVAPMINGVWEAFGSSCNITIQSAAVAIVVNNNYLTTNEELFVSEEELTEPNNEVIPNTKVMGDNYLETTSLSIYPNPISRNEYLNVLANNLSEGNYNISITDIYGKTIFNKEINVVNNINEKILLSIDLSTGTYFISVLGTNYLRTERILVK